VSVEAKIAPKDLHATIALLQDELEATNHEVMMLTLELEDRVAERTAQLAKTNEELLAEVRERTRAAAEIRQLNRDLNIRAAELEEANRDLEAFSYSVSHDLRAPLSQMMGFAAVLEEEAGAALSEKSRRYVGKVVSAGRKMADLIDNLLRFSRDAHRGMELRSVNLNELLENVIGECKQALGSRNVLWRVAQLPEAWCDAALLRQVFVNLISNALPRSLRFVRPRSTRTTPSFQSATTAWDSIRNMPINYLALFSVSTTAANSKARELVWPACAGLSPGTAAEFGRKAQSAPEPVFILVSR
jgi:K+-sensing histidine kinase KdpD